MNCVFVHADGDEFTTLSHLQSACNSVLPTEFLGCYAYATFSGARAFDLRMDADFWDNTVTKWVFGLDYGRTHPSALRYIANKPNAEIRIHDGDWIVEQEGFVPRRDFHLKCSVLSNIDAARFGVVAGSGNFSSNGLRQSIEAGSFHIYDSVERYLNSCSQFADVTSGLWENAAPLEPIFERYTERWHNAFSWAAKGGLTHVPSDQFWIEAGYVTQNRGPKSPGNQIDFPRGMSRFFGFEVPDDLPRNSVIGPVTIMAGVGEATTRNLRLGNNLMEKMSLPIPESHGFGDYDGKVLVFQKVGAAFALRALESADFDAAFGARIANV